jgi:hypothetical protein
LIGANELQLKHLEYVSALAETSSFTAQPGGVTSLNQR